MLMADTIYDSDDADDEGTVTFWFDCMQKFLQGDESAGESLLEVSGLMWLMKNENIGVLTALIDLCVGITNIRDVKMSNKIIEIAIGILANVILHEYAMSYLISTHPLIWDNIMYILEINNNPDPYVIINCLRCLINLIISKNGSKLIIYCSQLIEITHMITHNSLLSELLAITFQFNYYIIYDHIHNTVVENTYNLYSTMVKCNNWKPLDDCLVVLNDNEILQLLLCDKASGDVSGFEWFMRYLEMQLSLLFQQCIIPFKHHSDTCSNITDSIYMDLYNSINLITKLCIELLFLDDHGGFTKKDFDFTLDDQISIVSVLLIIGSHTSRKPLLLQLHNDNNVKNTIHDHHGDDFLYNNIVININFCEIGIY